MARSLVRNLRTPDPAHHKVPQRNASSRQAQWFVLSQVDSATVSTPDGRGVTFRRRDPHLFRTQLKTSALLLGTAAREWAALGAATARRPRT